jgi:hypothetical protein
LSPWPETPVSVPKAIFFGDLDNGPNLVLGKLRILAAGRNAQNAASCGDLDKIGAVLVSRTDGATRIVDAVDDAFGRSGLADQVGAHAVGGSAWPPVVASERPEV